MNVFGIESFNCEIGEMGYLSYSDLLKNYCVEYYQDAEGNEEWTLIDRNTGKDVACLEPIQGKMFWKYMELAGEVEFETHKGDYQNFKPRAVN